MRLEVKEAKHGFNCVGCRERVRTCEKYLQVTQDGKPVKDGRQIERYCVRCERIAKLNNPEIGVTADDDDDDGERHLRQAEDYAAYRAAGALHCYWQDRDEGYCH